MTQEDKELLLKDLCSRLPYGVIVRHADYLIDSDGNYIGQFWYKRGYLCNICRLDDMTTTIIESEGSDEEGYEHICDLERSLPYLRPISSMTEEEKNELKEISNNYLDEWENTKTSLERWKLDAKESYLRFIFYNSHHFDWNDLISKGLALEAPDGMYN